MAGMDIETAEQFTWGVLACELVPSDQVDSDASFTATGG